MCSKDENSNNRSEFIENAILFYSAYLNGKSAEALVPKSIRDMVDERLNETEKKISTSLFRLAVELSMNMNITAYHCDIQKEQISKLRHTCIRDLKNNGEYTFEDAYKLQKE